MARQLKGRHENKQRRKTVSAAKRLKAKENYKSLFANHCNRFIIATLLFVLLIKSKE